MFNGLLSDSSELTDVSVAGATLINLTDDDIGTDPAGLIKGDKVDLVLSADGKSVITIYVTSAAERAE